MSARRRRLPPNASAAPDAKRTRLTDIEVAGDGEMEEFDTRAGLQVVVKNQKTIWEVLHAVLAAQQALVRGNQRRVDGAFDYSTVKGR